MENSFDFTFFTPTPDTTANCALSRWNDSLNNISDFIKSYMTSRKSLEFGFSRSLNIKELLNLNKENVKSTNNKFDYVVNYNKYCDIIANVFGYSIPIVCFNNPFLLTKEFDEQGKFRDTKIDNYVIHVFDKNRTSHDYSERIINTLSALNAFISDIRNTSAVTDSQIARIFRKNRNGTVVSRQQAITNVQNIITTLQILLNNNTDALNFVFLFENKKNINKHTADSLNINYNIGYPFSNSEITDTNTENNVYLDILYSCCICDTVLNSNNEYDIKNFYLNIEDDYKKEFQDKYLTPNGIEFIYLNDVTCSVHGLSSSSATKGSHLLCYFRFILEEQPTIKPFLSHDGTYVPLSEQHITISYRIEFAKDGKNCWDSQSECPVSFFYDENNSVNHENISQFVMSLDSNINGVGGKDYTIWSSPVQKTANGFVFECCMPLAFYNAETDSYSNEYYALRDHNDKGVVAGQVMYRVPVVKRMRQNIEEAVVNNHVEKCLINTTQVDDLNCNNDNTVVIGGVVVDDFTEGLYSVCNEQCIASNTEYGDVKIVKTTSDVLDVMYHYSETGELSYNGLNMPDEGRAIDMITMFDVLKKLNGNYPITNNTVFRSNDNFETRFVTTHAEGDQTTGEDQDIYGEKTFYDKMYVSDIIPRGTPIYAGSFQNTFRAGHFEDVYANSLALAYEDHNLNVGDSVFSVNSDNELEIVAKGPSATISTTDNLHPYPISYMKISRDSNDIPHFEIVAQHGSTETDGKSSIQSDTMPSDGGEYFSERLSMRTKKGNYISSLHLNAGKENASHNGTCFLLSVEELDGYGNSVHDAYIQANQTPGGTGYNMTIGADSISTKGSIVPKTNNTDSLGSSISGFKDVYAEKLHGSIPTPIDSPESLEIGSIIMLNVKMAVSSVVGIGVILQAGNGGNVNRFDACSIDGSSLSGFMFNRLNDMKFRALSYGYVSSGAFEGPILCIRVA